MVYVDSPMATTATEVFRNNAHIFDEETKDCAIIDAGGDAGKISAAVESMHEMSPSEKQLAEENLRLKAEVDFLRTLVSLDDLNSKKK